MDNNIYTQIGIVLIIALASKNAILIVEFARELRAQGRSILRRGRRGVAAAVPADPDDVVRVHPGHPARWSSPTGAGAASRRALGTAVFGGMIAATVLAVFFVPVVLRRHAAAERVQAKTGGHAESTGGGFSSRAGRGINSLSDREDLR